MAKAGEEFELDLPEEEIIGDDDELLDGVPQKKRKVGGGRQKLTQERIVSTDQNPTLLSCNMLFMFTIVLTFCSPFHKNRLDHVGFQWVVANPNTKTWEERECMRVYDNFN